MNGIQPQATLNPGHKGLHVNTENALTPTPTPLTTNKQANNPASFDEMMEKKMVADIMRANNDLKAFKQFRVSNEKHYQDKYSDEMKRREIREPLENALTEISLLKGKVSRRDDTIKSLRRFILVDSLRHIEGSSGANVHEFLKNEEFKELLVSDENASLIHIIRSHEAEILKLKSLIQNQQHSIKELTDDIQKKEFLQQEIVRKFETEKEHHLVMIEKRDQRINRLCGDIEKLQNEKKDMETDFNALLSKLDKAEDKIKELLEQREQVNQMKDGYEERIEELNEEIHEQSEVNIMINEKMEDLQMR
jgi:chromosome segregation ATPase